MIKNIVYYATYGTKRLFILVLVDKKRFSAIKSANLWREISTQLFDIYHYYKQVLDPFNKTSALTNSPQLDSRLLVLFLSDLFQMNCISICLSGTRAEIKEKRK